jgi:sterol desaturase/sphingolipid hydroxylase (fatty acid hydroxylase superfamily)
MPYHGSHAILAAGGSRVKWAPVVVGLGVLMLCVERLAPGRAWPRVSGWWIRAIVLNVVQAGVVWLAGIAWDRWMQRHRPWSADGLGLVGGALVGYVAVTFVYYWWHRWRHEVPFLWRWLHQLHHSPQRIEVITSFYKHPVEIAVNGLLSSAILYLGVGLAPDAAALAIFLTGAAELFYHWNVRTPWWLGFVMQRPESHCVHHQAGLHSFNFADVPLWDWMFGTLRNPRAWESRCGFDPERERRLGDMLRGRDVHA